MQGEQVTETEICAMSAQKQNVFDTTCGGTLAMPEVLSVVMTFCIIMYPDKMQPTSF